MATIGASGGSHYASRGSGELRPAILGLSYLRSGYCDL
jgi:hypothetical protein